MLRNLDELLDFTRVDFAPLYLSAKNARELQPGDLLPDDVLFQRGDDIAHRARPA